MDDEYFTLVNNGFSIFLNPKGLKCVRLRLMKSLYCCVCKGKAVYICVHIRSGFRLHRLFPFYNFPPFIVGIGSIIQCCWNLQVPGLRNLSD